MSLLDSTSPSSDPAADFLARDNEALASLGILDAPKTDSLTNGALDAAFGTGDPFGGQPMTAPSAGASGQFMDTGFGDGAGTGTGSSLLDGGTAGMDGFGGLATGGEQQAPSDRFSALREADKERKLSPKVLAWQEKQKERIAKKDAEEEKKKQELREQAKRELSDWYRHYEEQIQLSNQRNSEAERAFLDEREESVNAAGQDATPTGGAAWERVARLCDFNPKNSKCTKDVSRYRGMLLQLKSPNGVAGATADGAAFN